MVSERGPNHRLWQRLSWVTNELGVVRAQTNAAYTELATGMHYGENGQWVESRPEIQLVAEGAAVTTAPHKVLFKANLNTIGAVDLITPDGKRLRSRIAAMSYSDPSTGLAVVLAQPKNSFGFLAAICCFASAKAANANAATALVVGDPFVRR